MSELPDRRLLLVHAHPDDETINNGATMARYVAEGAHVTLVTCTLGEEGEVLVPELAHLAADQSDQLGRHRIGELAAAMDELGVTDHRFLGGPGRYRDTGMIYDEQGNAAVPPDTRPDSFWQADLVTAANDLVTVIREVRPQVLVTYDEFGNYGHPDHVQAHRVATYAAALAAARSYREDLGPAWDIPKIYWTAISETAMRSSLRRLRESGDHTTFEGMDPDGPLGPMITPDRFIDCVIPADGYLDRKMNAMKAHATQITVDGPFFALSNNDGNEIFGDEFYRLVKGTAAPGSDGLEHDLFAGL
ncbi:1D-myo-inosityl-2-acetamido-2-deoxy-alpha-D-glucopyranosidedeacetylase [Kribbella flavida DSM 17836]|uniref:1D-myo-inositol 2-acetamido-2-deoxy-alpha-D-glucopyranoside deacetylase n=1 Tax=Kribbella flavida (strain DSM 17836 / JCM 10339 / NBRC 14399) TaxID=479435 RepID=MSHB_KRIFD|nr:N-acetyl-1-D-myo-inositol-2-amino-2-deoxy-alpha-D-glucopyranoside deacetylase [Kribbella flavida]D2PN56.1 RecName: Full=1D-myo-inositol 2-acetamido-2-deoxy-alpha-D-glucopyranoside deacetylase; Short=GlcNAc-Ins deacetylase; AltName: Full=N-acetyl-1-D-myo-inositol 2-amino-2-deoxy-alpha-D-glucopyranoside deacetylase [Kribbella flavida DSM 17836]ADB34540.1 1D-myo-inosityl-2-acetamido-2-deoxy-alpha-D-glucopyranosidedeacetylase [Kribbella flavida DSM 17836]